MNWCFLFSIPYIILLIREATVTVMKKRWKMSKMSNLHHSYNFPRLWKKMLRRIFSNTIFYFGTTLNFARSWFSYSIEKKKRLLWMVSGLKIGALAYTASIQYNERIQIDWLKREKLQIPPEFQAETVDLSCRNIWFLN